MATLRLLPTTNTVATLAIDGPASATWNTVLSAQNAYEGAAGNQISLAAVADGTWVPNIGTLTLAANAVAAETVTIDTTVYTWRAAPTTVAFEVLVGANASASIDNLIAAINLNGTAGTQYGSATTIHPTVRAFAGAGDTMVVHTKSNTTLTAVGTLIATTETMTQGSWGAATLADGTDGTNVTFVTTSTAIVCHFASGYSTAADFETALAADATAAALVRVSTAGTTPLYLLLVTDDDFSATNLTGGGSTTSAAPTLTDATAGKSIGHACDQVMILLRNVDTVTGTTKTASATIWGFCAQTGFWYKIGALSTGNAIAETSSDKINYAELVVGARSFSRLYCQIDSLGGAGTEVEVYAICLTANSTTV